MTYSLLISFIIFISTVIYVTTRKDVQDQNRSFELIEVRGNHIIYKTCPKDCFYGIMDLKGNVIQNNQDFGLYKKAQNGSYILDPKGNVVFINDRNELIKRSIPELKYFYKDHEYYSDYSSAYDYTVFKSSMMKQDVLIGADGNVIIVDGHFNHYFVHQFNYSFFTNGYANVQDDTYQIGLINQSGEIVIKPKYDLMGYLDDQGYTTVYLNGKHGVINSKDEEIIPLVYKDLKLEHELVVFLDDESNQYGILNLNNELIMNDDYDHIELNYLFNDQYQVIRDDETIYIDIEGNEITDFPYLSITELFYDNMTYKNMERRIDNLLVVERKDHLVALLDRDGNKLIDFKYLEIELINDEFFLVKDIDLNCGVVNSKNEVIIESNYHDIKPYHNQYFIVRSHDKWGLMNSLGETILAPNYQEIYPMNIKKFNWIDHTDSDDILFIVKVNNQFGVVNQTGKIVIDIKYKSIDPILDGYIFKVDASNQKDNYYNRNGMLINDSDILHQFEDKQNSNVYAVMDHQVIYFDDGNLMPYDLINNKQYTVYNKYSLLNETNQRDFLLYTSLTTIIIGGGYFYITFIKRKQDEVITEARKRLTI